MPAYFRPAVAAFAILGFAGPLSAQTSSAAGSDAASSKTGIAEAKRDFEKIKATRDATLVPSGSGPRVSVPELTLPSTAAPSSTTRSKAPPVQKRSANWLVDAMEKQNSTRGTRARDSREIDWKDRDGSNPLQSERLDREGADATENDSKDERRARAEEAERKNETAAAVVNPLNSFLGEWMTPRDYALLKPGLTPAAESGLAGGILLPAPGAGTVSTSTLGDLSLKNSAPANSALSAAPRENPYLQALKPEPSSTAVPGIVKPVNPPPVVPAAPVSSIQVSPAPTAPASRAPDFVRPGNDERYFKQLKRF